MALFKISKGNHANLGVTGETQYAKEGFAYFTPDTGKFYIDTAGGLTEKLSAVIGQNRIPLSADLADRVHRGTALYNSINKTYSITLDKITQLNDGTMLYLTVNAANLGDDKLQVNGFDAAPLYINNQAVTANKIPNNN